MSICIIYYMTGLPPEGLSSGNARPPPAQRTSKSSHPTKPPIPPSKPKPNPSQISNLNTQRSSAFPSPGSPKAIHSIGKVHHRPEGKGERVREETREKELSAEAMVGGGESGDGEGGPGLETREGAVEGAAGVLGEERFTVRTLYDFVDALSVQSLQAQTIGEMSVIKTMHFEGLEWCKEADHILDGLVHMRSLAQLPNTDIKNLDDTLEQLTKSVRESYMGESKVDPSVASRAGSRASSRTLETMEVSMGISSGLASSRMEVGATSMRSARIQSSGMLISRTAQRHGEAYQQALVFFENLERQIPVLSRLAAEAQTRAIVFRERALVVKGALQELRNLVVWYRQFHKAYGAMLLEIDRRHAQMAANERMVCEFQAKLDKTAKEEAKARDTFTRNFGTLPMCVNHLHIYIKLARNV
eukprot:1314718-Amorphochlora_amoeboformis.AAC.1